MAGILLAILTLFGVRQQIAIINPVTVLAQPADIEAITWLQRKLPADARLTVNSWSWLNGTWAGGDGGAWILPLSGRMTSTPPVDYAYDPVLAEEVTAFNEKAITITDWSAPEAGEWLADAGWTHVFVGAKGGFLDPAQLSKNPLMTEVYAKDGVFIFSIATK